MHAQRSSILAAGRLVALGVAVVVAAPSGAPHEADAALICQHQKKPKVFLRPNACKKKEQAVFDTGSEANQDSMLADLQSRATQTSTLLGAVCPEDPARRLLAVSPDVVGGLSMIGYLSTPLCRTLDDDAAACAGAYEVTAYGPSACAYLRGKCLPCDLPLDLISVCRNACQPPVTCAADPTRTTAVLNCDDVTTPAACAQAWSVTSQYATPTHRFQGTSCYWNTTAIPAGCERCQPADMSQGKCSNTCIATADLPRCRLGGRSYGRCDVHNGNPAACQQTYELGPYGTQTCWYDLGAAECHGCDAVTEAAGTCMNGC